jgi:negative regulator of sigma E activity
MSIDDKSRAQALVARLLNEAEERNKQRDYREALVAIRKAKALDSSNVYILAFERQVEQLQNITGNDLLAESQREEISESIPGILERALSQQTALRSPEEILASKADTEEERAEKEAARQWLKNQYFQRAHEHVRRGEYQLALWEIRRLHIIDSEDRFAMEFEKKILQLLQMQGPQPEVPALEEPEPQEPDMAKPTKAVHQPMWTPKPSAPKPTRTVEPRPKKRRRISPNTMLLIVTLITIAVLAFAFYYFWKREQSPERPVPEMTQPQ